MDHFTTVDTYLYWAFRRAQTFGLDLSPFPACLAHLARVERRASVRDALAYEARVEARFAENAR